MANICEEMLGQLSELDDYDLRTLARVLIRLSPDYGRLNDEIAANIGRMLKSDDLTELYQDGEQINRLARII